MKDIIIRISEQDIHVHGISAPIDNGYIVLVNANEPKAEQLAALLHEVIHIWHGDHFAGGNLEEIEAQRRTELQSFLQESLAAAIAG